MAVQNVQADLNANAQADLKLRCAHISEMKFSHVAVVPLRDIGLCKEPS